MKHPSISVLSIPGLPNGLCSLDSRFYHDYEPALGVIREVAQEKWGDVAVHFQSYIWPREVPHPWGYWTCFLPWVTIPLHYWAYLRDESFRERIIERGLKRLTQALRESDIVVVIAHSHGNRVGIDLLSRLQQQEGGRRPRLYFLSFAPAYSGVGFGLIPDSLAPETVEGVVASLEYMGGFRVKSDLLSGKPNATLDSFHSFRPRWYEWGFRAHASVRRRADIMAVLKRELGDRLMV